MIPQMQGILGSLTQIREIGIDAMRGLKEGNQGCIEILVLPKIHRPELEIKVISSSLSNTTIKNLSPMGRSSKYKTLEVSTS